MSDLEAIHERRRSDLRERFAAVPIYDVLGLRIEDLAPGAARLELRCGALHANLDGDVHGGILELMADTAMGLAARTRAEEGAANATVQMAISLQSAARVGDLLICEAQVTNVSRRFVWTTCDVRHRDGSALVAQATALQLHRPPAAAGRPPLRES